MGHGLAEDNRCIILLQSKCDTCMYMPSSNAFIYTSTVGNVYIYISKLKNICNVNVLGLPGKEKRKKVKKQEIRRVHNSNPLQRHSHVLFQ